MKITPDPDQNIALLQIYRAVVRASVYLENASPWPALAELRQVEQMLGGMPVDLRAPARPGHHLFVDGVCACGGRPTDDPVLCPVYGTNPYKHGIDVTPESDPDRTKHQLTTLADEIRLAGIRCGAICDWAVPNGPELIATIRGMADRINELQQKQRAED